MKTNYITNRPFLKLFFLTLALGAFNSMTAQQSLPTFYDNIVTNYNALTLNLDNDAKNSVIMLRNSSGVFTMTNTAGNAEFYTDPAKNTFFITDKVGIGTTAPTNKLHVNGAVRASSAVIGNKENGTLDYAYFGNVNKQLATTDLTNYAILQNGSGATSVNSSPGQDLSLRIGNSDKMIISASNSNVGIGVTGPITNKLHVNGAVRASSAVIGNKDNGTLDYAYFGNVNKQLATTDLTNYAILQNGSGATSVNSSSGQNLSLRINNNDQVVISAITTAINNRLIVTPPTGTYNTFRGRTGFGTDREPVIGSTVTVDGRVYISEDNQVDQNNNKERGFTNRTHSNYNDYLLWVEEGVVATDFAIASLTQWPDYVFNKDYKLNSLKEVASFIKDNGHLPTMPSAKEVEENGFTLSDITKRTVKTIEELTLHTIEQQKQLENQAQVIETLMKRLTALESNK